MAIPSGRICFIMSLASSFKGEFLGVGDITVKLMLESPMPGKEF